MSISEKKERKKVKEKKNEKLPSVSSVFLSISHLKLRAIIKIPSIFP
jgi:hypothetical protein